MTSDETPANGRAPLAIFGAVAGLCLWLLVEGAEEFDDLGRLFLFLITGSASFFAAALVMTGPLRLARAALLALPLGLVAGGLLAWASLRFGTVDAFLDNFHPIAAWLVLSTLPLPFLIAASTAERGWRDYPALHGNAWSIVARGLTAALFAGVFWFVYALCNAVLGIVGIDALGELAEEDWFRFLVTGGVLGLGMAVVNELSEEISPALLFRLLRLLLPAVTLVSAVFLIAVPFSGFEDTFGNLSAAATLLAMVIGALTLITAALDEDDEHATASPVLRVSAQVQALLLPLLAGLASWALWLRVAQHGWTPERILAGVAAAMAMLYALAYALAVLRRSGWMARIRGVNTWMALLTIALAALWLSPVLNAERLSVASQMARFEAGAVDAEGLDLWSIARDWGRAGEAALVRLEAMAESTGNEILANRLEQTGKAQHRFEVERAGAAAMPREEFREMLENRMRRAPGAEEFPDWLVAVLQHPNRADQVARACGLELPDGGSGCALALADLTDLHPGDEAAVFLAYAAERGINTMYVHPGSAEEHFSRGLHERTGELASRPPAEILSAIEVGRFRVGAPLLRTLTIGGDLVLIPSP